MSDLPEPTPARGLVGQRVGNYEIVEKIGEGGMGAVYLGRHPLIGKKVAIKVLLEDLVSNESIAARFFNEAKAANDIRHQNIVDVVDFGKIPKAGGGFVVYIMMEFLEGESLSARLKKGILALPVTRHVLMQCCSGLAASHAKGIIHRDLKPDNLFLIQRGSDGDFLKILDFGIAKLTATANTNAKTRTGTLIGTPAYMSPEQCSGRGNIDGRSDIYSLGVVMYEMITGRVPFEGQGYGDVVVGHLTEPPMPPSQLRANLPPEWEMIVLRALEKEPDKRFQTMEELGLALADPAAYAESPEVVAQRGLAAAAPTTSVPVVNAPTPPTGVLARTGETTRREGFGNTQPEPDTDVQSTVQAVAARREPTPTAAVSSRAPTQAASPAAQAKRRPAPVVGLIVAGVLVVAGVLLLRKPAPARAPVAVTPTVEKPIPPPPKPAPQPIVAKLASNPPGARVVRIDGDAALGTTPLTLKLTAGEPSFDVRIELEGYKPETRTIATDANSDIEVSLAKETKKKRAREADPAQPQAGAPPAAGDEEHRLLKPEL